MMLLLLLTLLAQQAAAGAPTNNAAVGAFAKQHTGAAAGVVEYGAKATSGKEKQLGGLTTYVSAPPAKPASSSSSASASPAPTAAVLLVTDVFGNTPTNTRAFADRLASNGLLVVVPDLFRGGARTKNDSAASFPAWLAKHPRARVLSDAEAVLADVKKAYPSVRKVGVVGFCWGGLYSVLLAGAGAKPAADAAVVYHGSLLTAADVEAVAKPIAFLQSDPALDKQINTTFYKQIEGILAGKRAKGLDAQITSYAGQPHGFSLRGASDPATTAAADKAFAAGLAFLNKHLK